MIVWTWGYRRAERHGAKGHSELAGYMDRLTIARIIDVRRNPDGKQTNPYWSGQYLQSEYGDKYRHVEPFGAGRWPGLVHLYGEHGAHEVAAKIAASGEDILLICAEDDPQQCHRREVAEVIAKFAREAGMQVEVRHLR